MSQETDRLSREADERRSSLDRTLDDLKGKFSPGQIVDELSAYVRDGQGADMVKNLNRQVRDNPLALGLVGAGIAWLLLGQGVRDGGQRLKSQVDDWRGEGDDDREWHPGRWADDDRDNAFVGSDRPARYASDYQDDLAHDVPRGVSSGSYSSGGTRDGGSVGSSVRSAASSAGSGIGSAASGAAGSVSDAAHAVGDAVSNATSSVADGASRLGHDARDAARRAGDASYRGASYAGGQASRAGRRVKRSFLDTLEEEPLILGAVAVAIGAAIGAALPSTRTEDEWLGETRDKLRDDAMSYGRDALDKAETVATKAYDAGSAEAEAKGLKPTGGDETMADKVSSVAQAAFGTAKDEAKKEGLV